MKTKDELITIVGVVGLICMTIFMVVNKLSSDNLKLYASLNQLKMEQEQTKQDSLRCESLKQEFDLELLKWANK